MWFNDFLRALADLVRATAWPAVVVFLLYRYRDRLGELIPRLRELFGAKFDPPPPMPQKDQLDAGSNAVQQLQALSQAVPSASVAVAGVEQLPPILQAARTPPVLEAEQMILNTNEMRALTGQAVRELALSTLSAALAVAVQFEQLEADIWASQIYLLQALNSTPVPLPRERVKASYYDVAAERFPAWFSDYPFDPYMRFLSSFRLINDGPLVTITDFGREYLVWRVRMGKRMKVNG